MYFQLPAGSLADQPDVAVCSGGRSVADMIANAHRQPGYLAIVEGAPGSGQSALLDRVAAVAAADGSLVLRAAASVLETDFPAGIIRQLFELPLENASVRQRRGWLRGAASLVPQIFRLDPDDPNGPDGSDSHAVSHAVFWLTVNLSRQQPVVILVDDLHWADSASLRWLTHLARRMADLPIAIVATITSGSEAADSDADLIAGLAAEARRVPPAGPDAAVTAPVRLVLPALAAVTETPGAEAPTAPSAPRRPDQRATFGAGALTPHEHRLIAMAVDGQTNGEIAEQFGVTRRAIEFHFTQIYRKLGIARRPQLYRFVTIQAALSAAAARRCGPPSGLLQPLGEPPLQFRGQPGRCVGADRLAARAVEHPSGHAARFRSGAGCGHEDRFIRHQATDGLPRLRDCDQDQSAEFRRQPRCIRAY
jgi:DNA-binding CsgD family transcriptional regulator